MTTAQMITQLKDNYLFDNDLVYSAGENPSDTYLIGFLDWAIRIISRKVRNFGMIPITFTAGNNTCSLTPSAGGFVSTTDAQEIIKVHRVYINSVPLKKPDGYSNGLWSFNELERAHPAWKTSAQGTPYACAHLGNNLIFYTTPSGSLTGTYMMCEYTPAKLDTVDLTKECPLPVSLHEAVCYLAAQKISIPQLTEQESFNRINLYQQYINDAINDVRKENENNLSDFGSVFGTKIRRWMKV